MSDPQKTDPEKTQKTLKNGPLAEIKQLYFRANRATIARDFDRAIDLIKSLPTEDERERATVYMQGLAEMKTQWGSAGAKSGVRSAKSGVQSPKSDVRSPQRWGQRGLSKRGSR